MVPPYAGRGSRPRPPRPRDRAAGHRHRVHGRGPLPPAAVPRAGRGRGRRPARSATSTVLDPLDDDLRPAPLAEVLADPDVEIVLHAGRQDVALLRRVCGDRRHATSSTRRSPPGFAGLRAQLGYEALLRELHRRPAAQDRELHALGRAAAQRRAGRATRARTSCTCSQLADALQERLDARGRLGVGARGVPRRSRTSPTSATSTRSSRGCRASTRSTPAQRAVARELVEWREGVAARRRPAGAERPARRGARRDRQAPAAEPRAARADPRAERGHAAPPRASRSSPPSSAAASATPIPVGGRAPPAARCGRRAADRAGRGARARPRAPRPSWPTSCSPRARTCSGSSPRVREGSPEPEVRTLQGWRRELVGDELLELLAGRRSLRVGPDRRIDVSP